VMAVRLLRDDLASFHWWKEAPVFKRPLACSAKR